MDMLMLSLLWRIRAHFWECPLNFDANRGAHMLPAFLQANPSSSTCWELKVRHWGECLGAWLKPGVLKETNTHSCIWYSHHIYIYIYIYICVCVCALLLICRSCVIFRLYTIRICFEYLWKTWGSYRTPCSRKSMHVPQAVGKLQELLKGWALRGEKMWQKLVHYPSHMRIEARKNWIESLHVSFQAKLVNLSWR